MLLRAKNVFLCCGIYLTTSSYSPQAFTAIRDARMNLGMMIIPLDKSDLPGLIKKGFRIFIQEKFDMILAKA
jgi:hypothetical protein